MPVTERLDRFWQWFISPLPQGYEITGKYLFFSADRERLVKIARNEIESHGFHKAKINIRLIGKNTEYVLVLYYKDDSRRQELAERNAREYGVKYRYWKSDEATLKGQYSKGFLSRLPEKERGYFTQEKVLVEIKDEKGNLISRKTHPKKQAK
jgi:hypothetical protein